MSDVVLDVRDLSVTIGRREIVHSVSFSVEKGQTLGIVGESGSGKSLTVLAATGLLDAPASRVTGSSRLDGTELVGASPAALRALHGNTVGFVFQDPATSLNPLLTLERQITEPIEVHRGATRREARTRALELLEAVGIPKAEARLGAYPHQLSGGQRQRVMIAVALANDPELLIADEPTTALDVTTQAQIIDLVADLQQRIGSSVVWISHDLGVIARVAQDVLVLRHGRVVEHRPTLELLDDPGDDYTRELLQARPVIGKHHPAPADPEAPTVLEVSGLDVRFSVSTPSGKEEVHAVDDVSFSLRRGHTLGIVGESGSGKSTIANALTGIVPATAGSAVLEDEELLGGRRKRSRAARRKLAMVFQDPFSSLDPKARVQDSITEPLIVHGLAKGAHEERVQELLGLVELPAQMAQRYPHELSGGQRQRISIARALALEPSVMILDEATASLDVSIQAKVLALLTRLQDELGLTYLFIAHDLAIVQQMSHEVLVLQNGRTQEYRAAADLFADPESDYTRTLLDAVLPERPVTGSS